MLSRLTVLDKDVETQLKDLYNRIATFEKKDAGAVCVLGEDGTTRRGFADEWTDSKSVGALIPTNGIVDSKDFLASLISSRQQLQTQTHRLDLLAFLQRFPPPPLTAYTFTPKLAPVTLKIATAMARVGVAPQMLYLSCAKSIEMEPQSTNLAKFVVDDEKSLLPLITLIKTLASINVTILGLQEQFGTNIVKTDGTTGHVGFNKSVTQWTDVQRGHVFFKAFQGTDLAQFVMLFDACRAMEMYMVAVNNGKWNLKNPIVEECILLALRFYQSETADDLEYLDASEDDDNPHSDSDDFADPLLANNAVVAHKAAADNAPAPSDPIPSDELVAAYEKEFKTQAGEIKRLKDDLAATFQVLKAKKRNVEEAEAMYERVKTVLHEERSSRESQLKEYDTRQRALEAEVARLIASLEEAERELAEARDNDRQTSERFARMKCDELQKQLNTVQADLSKVREEQAQAQDQLRAAVKKVEDAQSATTAAQNELKDAQVEIALLEAALNTASQEAESAYARFESKVQALTVEIASLEEALAKTKEQVQANATEHERNKTTIANLNRLIVRLKQSHDEAQGTIHGQNQRIGLLEQTTRRVEEQAAAKELEDKNRIEKLTLQMVTLERARSQEQAANESQKQQIALLKQKKQELEAQADAAASEKAGKIKELNDEVEALREESAELTKNTEAQQAAIAALEADLDALKVQNAPDAPSASDPSATPDAMEELRKKIRRLNVEKMALEEGNEALEKGNKALEEGNKELKDKLDALQLAAASSSKKEDVPSEPEPSQDNSPDEAESDAVPASAPTPSPPVLAEPPKVAAPPPPPPPGAMRPNVNSAFLDLYKTDTKYQAKKLPAVFSRASKQVADQEILKRSTKVYKLDANTITTMFESFRTSKQAAPLKLAKKVAAPKIATLRNHGNILLQYNKTQVDGIFFVLQKNPLDDTNVLASLRSLEIGVYKKMANPNNGFFGKIWSDTREKLEKLAELENIQTVFGTPEDEEVRTLLLTLQTAISAGQNFDAETSHLYQYIAAYLLQHQVLLESDDDDSIDTIGRFGRLMLMGDEIVQLHDAFAEVSTMHNLVETVKDRLASTDFANLLRSLWSIATVFLTDEQGRDANGYQYEFCKLANTFESHQTGASLPFADGKSAVVRVYFFLAMTVSKKENSLAALKDFIVSLAKDVQKLHSQLDDFVKSKLDKEQLFKQANSSYSTRAKFDAAWTLLDVPAEQKKLAQETLDRLRDTATAADDLKKTFAILDTLPMDLYSKNTSPLEDVKALHTVLENLKVGIRQFELYSQKDPSKKPALGFEIKKPQQPKKPAKSSQEMMTEQLKNIVPPGGGRNSDDENSSDDEDKKHPEFKAFIGAQYGMATHMLARRMGAATGGSARAFMPKLKTRYEPRSLSLNGDYSPNVITSMARYALQKAGIRVL